MLDSGQSMNNGTNIRRLSNFTLILITLIFALVTFDRSQNIYNHFLHENESYANLIANSTSSYFKQIQMILDLIGNQLLEDNNYQNTQKSKAIFDRMLRLNNSIIGYALIEPSGNYLLTHLDTPPEDIPNVLTREAAKDSFLHTLSQKRMVIGRTYFLNATQALAIPVRMPFYDTNGIALAVMAVAIDANNPEIFDASLLNSDTHMIHLFRDIDRYRQLYLHNTKSIDPQSAYNNPIQKAIYQQVMDSISQYSGEPLEQIKRLGTVVSITYEDQLQRSEFLVSARFIPELDLWATSYLRLSAVYISIAIDIAKLTLVFLFAVGLLLFLFRRLDESEQQKKQDLEHQAKHDSLTELPNRRFLQQNAKELLGGKKPLQIMLFSIDDLKAIEDIYGYSIAEDFLCTFVGRALCEKQHKLIQLGSNEFLLISNSSSEQRLTEISKLKDYLQQSITCHGILINFTLSMGVAKYPSDEQDIHALIRFADMAHQESRKERNRITVFTPKIEAAFIRRLMIEKQIRPAISSGEFTIMYQPQIRYPHKIYGVEALVRWHNHQLGFVSPAEFIPIAEASALMPLLGEHIIEQTCQEMSEFIRHQKTQFQLSLNISAKQFMHEGFVPHLMRHIQMNNLNPERITLELTESIFIHDLNYLINVLQELRQKGFKISMDDFGTGFSSLSMLRRIPLDEIKIDKSFVDEITQDQSAEYVAKTIILIAKELNYKVLLAEGTESKEQVEILQHHGCNTFQGYYFSKPLTVDQLGVYFKTQDH